MTSVFRIENPKTAQGLWYSGEGIFNPFITKVLTNAQCRDLPMEFDPQFKLDGLDWYSACDNLPGLSQWFSLQDLDELAHHDYNLYQFDVTKYRELTGHAVFAREHIQNVHQLNLDVLKKMM